MQNYLFVHFREKTSPDGEQVYFAISRDGFQWEALNDRVPDAEPSWAIRNFRLAGKMMAQQRDSAQYVPPKYTYRGFQALPEDINNPEDDKFYGFLFQDSDFSKWIEAVGYSLTQHPDPELEQIADGAIDVVCAAQTPEGYLDTYYIINGMDAALTNLRDNHELYCLGHLLEGAVAYYQATGKNELLRAAARFAEEGRQFDVIVVDPPRKGLNADTIEALHRMDPRRIVYVSCDPATLARDVALLKERGYVLKNAMAADLFPRCAHVESVVTLSKGEVDCSED